MSGPTRKPRLGFLGVGWIGRSRMEAMLATGAVTAAAVCEPSDEMAAEALAVAPGAERVGSLEALLAVFCQKPLGRDASEAAAVVAAARSADRLLGVDFSYRHTAGMSAIAPLVQSAALGRLQAIDLVFHNAYGPDKPWFYDRAQSGGGCVMDLGVHLVDLALWATGFPALQGEVQASLFAGGAPIARDAQAVEDLALASFTLEGGIAVRLACSWRLHAGRPAEISAAFYGTEGGAALRNVDGSFYDFTAERFRGTEREVLASHADAWGGRAGADWALSLAAEPRFDPATERLVDVAAVLDRIYGR